MSPERNANDADATHMARALELAERGLYTTDPNPRVGCVLVRDGTVIGEGWHVRAGEPHAVVLALRAAGERARAQPPMSRSNPVVTPAAPRPVPTR